MTPGQRFFMGVRKLGPDMRFVPELSARQAVRIAASQAVWRPAWRPAALALGQVFHSTLRWPGRYFLPDDQISVIMQGCYADIGRAVDSEDIRDACRDIDRLWGRQHHPAFWGSCIDQPLIWLVEQLETSA
ncbi:hypothetical protein [Dyella sp.]|uniref:hypothetical protein n=1 Tax=Dyella sp. TaxID=1869338 RepID=UPI002ED6238A